MQRAGWPEERKPEEEHDGKAIEAPRSSPGRSRRSQPRASLGPAAAGPGHKQVDFEERVDFRRLHDYRLARTRQALAASGLGALLCFDQYNIRYISSTVIGEWARDKLHALLPAHRQRRAVGVGFRLGRAPPQALRAVAARRPLPSPACSACAARSVADGRAVRAGGAGDQGHPRCRRAWRTCRSASTSSSRRCCSRCRKLGIEVRDGQQMMLQAREIKSHDEITLLNMAAAMVDGVYQDISEALKPGVQESEIVALATKRLYEMGSDCVEAINAISGERCSPHPHNFTDRLIRPGDQAFFDIIQSFMGYRTCYYRTFSVGRATQPQRDAYKKAREWMDDAIALLKPGVGTDKVAQGVPEGAGDRLRERDGRLRPELLPRPGPGPARAAADLAPQLVRRADRAQGRHGVRGRDLLPGDRRHLGRAHRGGGGPDAGGREDHHAVPGRGAAGCEQVLETAAGGDSETVDKRIGLRVPTNRAIVLRMIELGTKRNVWAPACAGSTITDALTRPPLDP